MADQNDSESDKGKEEKVRDLARRSYENLKDNPSWISAIDPDDPAFNR